MNNRCFCLIAFLSLSTIANAQTRKLQADFYTGFQRTDFRWSIAGNLSGTRPNIYSELKWQDLHSQAFNIDLAYNIWKGFMIKGGFSTAWSNAGRVNDTDYQGDDRTRPVYNSTFDANKGFMNSFTAQLQYRFKLGRHSVTPFAGYGAGSQTFYLLGTVQQTGFDLKSSYTVHTKGPVYGARGGLTLSPKTTLEPAFSYHQVRYDSHANWNLINSFQHPVSFRQNANGYALETAVNIRFKLSSFWSLFTGINYGHLSTGNGVDRLFMTNGNEPLTQFNGAVNNNWGFGGGMSFAF